MKKDSKYGPKPPENLKVTYFLGAGASYYSIPILNSQGRSMIDVGYLIKNEIHPDKGEYFEEKFKAITKNEYLSDLSERIINFGNKAMEYGSLDIYARRLHLLGNYKELNDLKFCLSVYFEIWESYAYEILGMNLFSGESKSYDPIDKRYLSLLSVLLEESTGNPKLPDSVSFLSWNYDLQLERAYASFLSNPDTHIDELNGSFQYRNHGIKKRVNDIIHLNGYRGFFKYDGEHFPISRKKHEDFKSLLLELIDNQKQFRKVGGKEISIKESIQYAWEEKDAQLGEAIKVMDETNVLIIIGYSFPSFNRKIDSQLIKVFEKSNQSYKKVIYQDPGANLDLVNSIFSDADNMVKVMTNTDQFHIPHEFLFSEINDELLYV